MQNLQEFIAVPGPRGAVYVSVEQAVRLLSVHPKTAQRWARGQQPLSRERAALLGILSGQVVPWAGWQDWQVIQRQGPAPWRRPFAVLVGPDGRTVVPDL